MTWDVGLADAAQGFGANDRGLAGRFDRRCRRLDTVQAAILLERLAIFEDERETEWALGEALEESRISFTEL